MLIATSGTVHAGFLLPLAERTRGDPSHEGRTAATGFSCKYQAEIVDEP